MASSVTSLVQMACDMLDTWHSSISGVSANRSACRHAIEAAKVQWRQFLLEAPDYPSGHFQGKGVVILAGNLHYMVPAWVNVVSLRRAGRPEAQNSLRCCL